MSERPSRVGVEQTTCSMMIFVSVGVGSQWTVAIGCSFS